MMFTAVCSRTPGFWSRDRTVSSILDRKHQISGSVGTSGTHEFTCTELITLTLVGTGESAAKFPPLTSSGLVLALVLVLVVVLDR